MDERAEWQAAMQDRCAGYSFLARVYREEIRADELQEMLSGAQQAGDEEDSASDGQALLERFVRQQAGANLDQAVINLAADYARLFLNMGPEPAFPYESVYTSAERLLMQEARDDVLQAYRAEALAEAPSLHQPEDHIAIEFEFMAHLCRQASEALAAGDCARALAYLRKQQEFLAQHLLVWVPAFVRDVERAAATEFYRGVGRLTAEFLDQEQETLPALVAEIES